jgi:hypothetical protein
LHNSLDWLARDTTAPRSKWRLFFREFSRHIRQIRHHSVNASSPHLKTLSDSAKSRMLSFWYLHCADNGSDEEPRGVLGYLRRGWHGRMEEATQRAAPRTKDVKDNLRKKQPWHTKV